MASPDEFTKILLDKIITNVISCLPLIENMFKDQNHELYKKIGITNKRDFILGSVWCIVLEKFIITCYLHTGKTINYENGICTISPKGIREAEETIIEFKFNKH